jgi:hypothetical protein
MTQFKKAQFQVGKGYKATTTYYHNGKHEFIARFRTAGVGTFVTFLIKNFTVEEYLGRLAAGESPLGVAGSKGYLLPHIKKWLKQGGYEVSQAGYQAYIKDRTLRFINEPAAA